MRMRVFICVAVLALAGALSSALQVQRFDNIVRAAPFSCHRCAPEARHRFGYTREVCALLRF